MIETYVVPVPMSPVEPLLSLPDIDYLPGGKQRDPFDEYYRNLARKTKNTRDEIYNKRYSDLKDNPGNLPWRMNPGERLEETVRGHENF